MIRTYRNETHNIAIVILSYVNDTNDTRYCVIASDARKHNARYFDNITHVDIPDDFDTMSIDDAYMFIDDVYVRWIDDGNDAQYDDNATYYVKTS